MQGKVDHKRLPDPDFVRSWQRRNTIEQDLSGGDFLKVQLTQIWEEVFDIRPVDPEDNFFGLGGDSLLAVQLVSRIQEELGHNLPLSVLLAGSSVRDLSRLLRQRRGTSAFSPLVTIRPGGDLPPFFCVHPAGGNVLNYVHLARRMLPQQPFHALQAIGLDGSREPVGEVEEMARIYIEEIRRLQPQGPYLLGGHSFGGLVAYEIAQQLRRDGQATSLLALLDTWAPVYHGRPLPDSVWMDTSVQVAALANTTARIYSLEAGVPVAELSQVAPPERMGHALKRLEEAGLAAEGIEQTRRIMKIHLSTSQASRNYRPRPYPGPVTLFKAPQEEEWARQYRNHPAGRSEELWSGWNWLTSQPVEIIEVPGDHSTMLLEPNVKTLAGRLTACIQRAAEAPTRSLQAEM